MFPAVHRANRVAVKIASRVRTVRRIGVERANAVVSAVRPVTVRGLMDRSNGVPLRARTMDLAHRFGSVRMTIGTGVPRQDLRLEVPMIAIRIDPPRVTTGLMTAVRTVQLRDLAGLMIGILIVRRRVTTGLMIAVRTVRLHDLADPMIAIRTVRPRATTGPMTVIQIDPPRVTTGPMIAVRTVQLRDLAGLMTGIRTDRLRVTTGLTIAILIVRLRATTGPMIAIQIDPHRLITGPMTAIRTVQPRAMGAVMTAARIVRRLRPGAVSLPGVLMDPAVRRQVREASTGRRATDRGMMARELLTVPAASRTVRAVMIAGRRIARSVVLMVRHRTARRCAHATGMTIGRGVISIALRCPANALRGWTGSVSNVRQ